MSSKKNKSEIPIYICVIIIAICIVGMFVDLALGVVTVLVAAIFAYRVDNYIKIPVASVVLLIAGIICYVLGYQSYPLYSTLCLLGSAIPIVCVLIRDTLGMKTFEEGLIYTAISSAIVMMLLVVLYFYLSQKTQMHMAILERVNDYFTNTDSELTKSIMYIMSISADAMQSTKSPMEIIQSYEIADNAELIEKSMVYMENFVRYNYPTFLIVYPIGASGIVWWAGNRIAYRGVERTSDGPKLMPKPFASFGYPRWMINVIMLLILAAFVLEIVDDSDMVMMYISVTLQSVGLFLIAIQGFAVMSYFLRRNKVFGYGIIRITTIIVVSAISIGFIPLTLGMIDIIVNIRKVYTKYQQVKNNPEQKGRSDDESNT